VSIALLLEYLIFLDFFLSFTLVDQLIAFDVIFKDRMSLFMLFLAIKPIGAFQVSFIHILDSVQLYNFYINENYNEILC
jgi:hypothetical protein